MYIPIVSLLFNFVELFCGLLGVRAGISKLFVRLLEPLQDAIVVFDGAKVGSDLLHARADALHPLLKLCFESVLLISSRLLFSNLKKK